jgi:hypothetical protein
MLDRIMSIINDRLDDAQQYKGLFNRNPMQPIVFDILREIKQKNGKIQRAYKENLPTDQSYSKCSYEYYTGLSEL